MPRNRNVSITPVTTEEALSHLAQAEEFLRASEHALGTRDFNAATGTALDAAAAEQARARARGSP